MNAHGGGQGGPWCRRARGFIGETERADKLRVVGDLTVVSNRLDANRRDVVRCQEQQGAEWKEEERVVIDQPGG